RAAGGDEARRPHGRHIPGPLGPRLGGSGRGGPGARNGRPRPLRPPRRRGLRAGGIPFGDPGRPQGIGPGRGDRPDRAREAALRRDPGDYSILVMSAMLRHLQGRFEDEVAMYREVLRGRPGDLLASNNLAWALSEGLGKPAEALALLDAALAKAGRVGWVL